MPNLANAVGNLGFPWEAARHRVLAPVRLYGSLRPRHAGPPPESFDRPARALQRRLLVVPNRMTRRRRRCWSSKPAPADADGVLREVNGCGAQVRGARRAQFAGSLLRPLCPRASMGAVDAAPPAIPPRRARPPDRPLRDGFARTGTRRDAPAPDPGARARASHAAPVARARAGAGAGAAGCAWPSRGARRVPSRERRHSGGGGAAPSALSRLLVGLPRAGRRRPARRRPRRRRRRRRRAREAEEGDDDDLSEEEGVQCAICHGNIRLLQVALVCGCEHPFCTGCILNWALQKKKCPLRRRSPTSGSTSSSTARSTTTSTRMSTSTAPPGSRRRSRRRRRRTTPTAATSTTSSCSTSVSGGREEEDGGSTSTCRKRSHSGAAAAAPSATGCGAQGRALGGKLVARVTPAGAAVDAEGEGEVGGAADEARRLVGVGRRLRQPKAAASREARAEESQKEARGPPSRRARGRRRLPDRYCCGLIIGGAV